ncbi:MAG: aromatic acid exporter family protein [Cellulosilyticaceae bacterium]
MKKIVGIRTLKTAIGATIAIIIASMIGLKYSPSAGIITILSIQSTKKQSIQIAIKRFVATLIAFLVSGILFALMGYNPIIFGLYLLVFIPITAKFNLSDGIVMASVLVTHLLVEASVNEALLINEILLVLIGIGVALVLNIYMPSAENELAKQRQEIEQIMYALFCKMSDALEGCSVAIEEQTLFDRLEQKIIEARADAYKYSNNHLFARVSPYERYFEMRARQLQVMHYMREHFSRFFMTYEETKTVATFAKKVAISIKGEIKAKDLLSELALLREDFKKSNLPSTREEFENRAMLYQYLNDIEHFLAIKEEFRESLNENEIKLYEQGYGTKN